MSYKMHILVCGGTGCRASASKNIIYQLEECLKDAQPGERFQFVRTGYFTPDSKHPGVYNRIVTLKDSFKL